MILCRLACQGPEPFSGDDDIFVIYGVAAENYILIHFSPEHVRHISIAILRIQDAGAAAERRKALCLLRASAEAERVTWAAE